MRERGDSGVYRVSSDVFVRGGEVGGAGGGVMCRQGCKSCFVMTIVKNGWNTTQKVDQTEQTLKDKYTKVSSRSVP